MVRLSNYRTIYDYTFKRIAIIPFTVNSSHFSPSILGFPQAQTEITVFAVLLYIPDIYTVWCNRIGTVFAVMSSWIALTWHPMMKTTFLTKYMKSIYIKIFLCDWRKCIPYRTINYEFAKPIKRTIFIDCEKSTSNILSSGFDDRVFSFDAEHSFSACYALDSLKNCRETFRIR